MRHFILCMQLLFGARRVTASSTSTTGSTSTPVTFRCNYMYRSATNYQEEIYSLGTSGDYDNGGTECDAMADELSNMRNDIATLLGVGSDGTYSKTEMDARLAGTASIASINALANQSSVDIQKVVAELELAKRTIGDLNATVLALLASSSDTTGHVGLDAASNDRIAALEAELVANAAASEARIAALEAAIADSAGASTAKGLDAASEARIAALEAALAAKADQIELDAANTKIQTGFIVGIVGPVFLVVILVVAAVCMLRDRGL